MLAYGLVVKFLTDPAGVVPPEGFLSYVPLLMGALLLALGLLRRLGK